MVKSFPGVEIGVSAPGLFTGPGKKMNETLNPGEKNTA
jgi:hypothetical protein